MKRIADVKKVLTGGEVCVSIQSLTLILLAQLKVLIIPDNHTAPRDSRVIYGLETQILYCNPWHKIILERWLIGKQAADVFISAACQTTPLYLGQPDWLISGIMLHGTRLL
jgi:hypothetical protein